MATDRFQRINDLESGDRIRIHLTGDGPVEAGGVAFPNPWETTVGSVHEERKDPRKGDEVRHIEFHRTVRLDPPDEIVPPDRVVLKTAHRMDQENTLQLTFTTSEDGFDACLLFKISRTESKIGGVSSLLFRGGLGGRPARRPVSRVHTGLSPSRARRRYRSPKCHPALAQ